MAAQYLLPCECGNTTPVDFSQAGNSVVCSCGKQLDVPSLRAIRELEPRLDQVSKTTYDWNPAAGFTFVIGLLLAVAGIGVAIFMHVNALRAVDFDLPEEEELTAWVDAIDHAPPEDLVDMWNVSREMGLGDHQTSPFVQARMVSNRLALYRNIALIVMGSGILFAATSFFMRGKLPPR